jgi:GH24 family phage-related lysozyme (muramidase)
MTNAVVLTPPDIRLLLSQMLEREEGLRTLVYDDATGKPIGPGSVVQGHPTIGIGRALDVNGITAVEADFLLENDATTWRRSRRCSTSPLAGGAT